VTRIAVTVVHQMAQHCRASPVRPHGKLGERALRFHESLLSTTGPVLAPQPRFAASATSFVCPDPARRVYALAPIWLIGEGKCSCSGVRSEDRIAP
jgi:hypothetical protein